MERIRRKTNALTFHLNYNMSSMKLVYLSGIELYAQNGSLCTRNYMFTCQIAIIWDNWGTNSKHEARPQGWIFTWPISLAPSWVGCYLSRSYGLIGEDERADNKCRFTLDDNDTRTTNMSFWRIQEVLMYQSKLQQDILQIKPITLSVKNS
jgi:hypothetical protein